MARKKTTTTDKKPKELEKVVEPPRLFGNAATKRRIIVPIKPVDGEVLEAALIAGGVPIIGGGAIAATPTELIVTLDLDIGDSSKDAAALAIINAHVAGPDKTPQQIRRERGRKLLNEYPDLLPLMVRAFVDIVIDATMAERAAYNALRADLRASRVGASGTAPALPTPTKEQIINMILNRIDELVT